MGTKNKLRKRIPRQIWERCNKIEQVIDIKLSGGVILKEIYINELGEILGRDVGGRDGIDESLIDFGERDILAVRRRDGLLGSLGLTKWIGTG